MAAYRNELADVMSPTETLDLAQTPNINKKEEQTGGRVNFLR